MCIACIAEFHRLIKFKRSCVETQEQFGELEYQREHNGIVIKREIEPEEEKFCGFIYLDTDEEDNSDEDGSRRVCAVFDIPHVPIKEEHMARVPLQNSDKFQPPEPKNFASPVDSRFDMIDNDALWLLSEGEHLNHALQHDHDAIPTQSYRPHGLIEVQRYGRGLLQVIPHDHLVGRVQRPDAASNQG